MTDRGVKRVLNAGSGAADSGRLHPGFAGAGWAQARLDIDPRAAPDLIGSIADMRALIANASFDAIWSSHSIEHLRDHEVAPAFAEFARILKPDGFALVTCPDLGAIARHLAREGPEAVVYQSPAGPIRALDMLYGHAPSIAAGRGWMAHHTGFTAERLGRVASEAGFAETRIAEGPTLDLWAVLLMPRARAPEIAASFAGTNVAGLFAEARAGAGA